MLTSDMSIKGICCSLYGWVSLLMNLIVELFILLIPSHILSRQGTVDSSSDNEKAKSDEATLSTHLSHHSDLATTGSLCDIVAKPIIVSMPSESAWSSNLDRVHPTQHNRLVSNHKAVKHTTLTAQEGTLISLIDQRNMTNGQQERHAVITNHVRLPSTASSQMCQQATANQSTVNQSTVNSQESKQSEMGTCPRDSQGGMSNQNHQQGTISNSDHHSSEVITNHGDQRGIIINQTNQTQTEEKTDQQVLNNQTPVTGSRNCGQTNDQTRQLTSNSSSTQSDCPSDVFIADNHLLNQSSGSRSGLSSTGSSGGPGHNDTTSEHSSSVGSNNNVHLKHPPRIGYSASADRAVTGIKDKRPIFPSLPYSPYGSPHGSPRLLRQPTKETRRLSIGDAEGYVVLNQYKLKDEIGKVRPFLSNANVLLIRNNVVQDQQNSYCDCVMFLDVTNHVALPPGLVLFRFNKTTTISVG